MVDLFLFLSIDLFLLFVLGIDAILYRIVIFLAASGGGYRERESVCESLPGKWKGFFFVGCFVFTKRRQCTRFENQSFFLPTCLGFHSRIALESAYVMIDLDFLQGSPPERISFCMWRKNSICCCYYPNPYCLPY